MFYSLSGTQPYETIYGFRFRKLFVPFLYLIFCSLAVPNASFSGHLFGILAALSIKYFGFYRVCLLP